MNKYYVIFDIQMSSFSMNQIAKWNANEIHICFQQFWSKSERLKAMWKRHWKVALNCPQLTWNHHNTLQENGLSFLTFIYLLPQLVHKATLSFTPLRIQIVSRILFSSLFWSKNWYFSHLHGMQLFSADATILEKVAQENLKKKPLK